MKTAALILYVFLYFGAAYPALTQSGFFLGNFVGPNINAPVFDVSGNRLDGSNYVAELWGGNTPDSLTPALGYHSSQRVIIPFMSANGAGYFRDTYTARDPADHPTVLSVPPYVAAAWLEVRAWDVRLGATYEEAVARGLGGFGESPLFMAVGMNPQDLNASPHRLTGLQSFSLRPVIPEPQTWALLALGLAVLAWQRHRTK